MRNQHVIDRNIYPKIEIQGQQKQTHAGIGTTIDWLSLTIPSSLTWEPITIHLQREREVSKEPDDRSFNSLVLFRFNNNLVFPTGDQELDGL